MAGGVSSSKRNPSKKKITKTSAQKKNKVKKCKRRHRKHDPTSSYSDDSFNSDCSSSSKSVSEYRRKKNTSKKRHRRDYSVSSYSNDYSISTDSDSLSTHDNIRMSKKSRKSKTSLKSSRKRARKRYSILESDGDARQTKRKRLTGDRVVKPKKKSPVKKSKKQLSRSSSPDSLSCSTCPTKSSSSSSSRSKQIVNEETEMLVDRNRKARSQSGDISVGLSHSKGALPLVNNSRRLRSVITLAYQPDEAEDRWDNDPRKEEIMHELDGDPSHLCLDSNKGGNKRETDSHSHGISNKRIHVEHEAITEHADTNDVDKEKEKDVPVPVAALDGNDIESILRQKALENLRKFKVGLQKAPRSITHTKMNNENDDLEKSTEQAIPNMQLATQRSACSEVKKHPEEEPGMEQTIAQPSGGAPFVGHLEENLHTSSNAALAQAVSVSDVNPGKQAADVSNHSVVEKTSCARPSSEKHSSEEQQDEAPEFEQKTMSVMRGGEMVQVTYKVKIPKRAPALGRRQLKR